jgi:hypothetical protein
VLSFSFIVSGFFFFFFFREKVAVEFVHSRGVNAKAPNIISHSPSSSIFFFFSFSHFTKKNTHKHHIVCGIAKKTGVVLPFIFPRSLFSSFLSLFFCFVFFQPFLLPPNR